MKIVHYMLQCMVLTSRMKIVHYILHYMVHYTVLISRMKIVPRIWYILHCIVWYSAHHQDEDRAEDLVHTA